MTADNFYGSMPSFRDCSDVTNDEYYRSVPSDWTIFVTDVKNSTEAIEAGRYRDVNKIGAASITVVKEGLGNFEFPFVFGGDGATIVLPPDRVNEAKSQLLGLKQLANDQFDLDLRVGMMTVDDVVQPEVSLEVAKFELTPGREISIFRGGGKSMADDLIKKDRSRFEVEGDAADVALEGLSCRWQPIPAERGRVMSILVQARVTPPEETYDRLLERLDDILDGGLNQSNPVDPTRMSYKTVWECLEDEIRYQPSIFSLSFLFRFLEILLAVAVFRLGINPGFFDPDEYSKSLRTHSDYRKFDDMLRLIVDCNDEEKKEIDEYLKERHRDGQLFYGIQVSDESLMTCYVEELDQGGHIHFIDGGSGGYARAAKQLKTQVREAAQSSS